MIEGSQYATPQEHMEAMEQRLSHVLNQEREKVLLGLEEEVEEENKKNGVTPSVPNPF